MPTRMVDISFIHSETLLSCHEELRTHYEPMILAHPNEPEAQTMAHITLRTVRLALSSLVLCQNGLIEECQLPLRSATESLINLLYIMYVGPAMGDKPRRDLALQFVAYGDVAYFKMLNKRPAEARSAFLKTGMTDAQFDAFLEEHRRLADNALSTHGCTKMRWHSLDLQSMADKVRDNAPDFVDKGITSVAFSKFQSANSATHADALSLRSQYATLGNDLLELKLQQDNTFCEIASAEAVWAWKVVGDYFGELEFVDQCISRHMRDIMKARYDVSPDAP
jgi:hypothetical protein